MLFSFGTIEAELTCRTDSTISIMLSTSTVIGLHWCCCIVWTILSLYDLINLYSPKFATTPYYHLFKKMQAVQKLGICYLYELSEPSFHQSNHKRIWKKTQHAPPLLATLRHNKHISLIRRSNRFDSFVCSTRGFWILRSDRLVEIY